MQSPQQLIPILNQQRPRRVKTMLQQSLPMKSTQITATLTNTISSSSSTTKKKRKNRTSLTKSSTIGPILKAKRGINKSLTTNNSSKKLKQSMIKKVLNKKPIINTEELQEKIKSSLITGERPATIALAGFIHIRKNDYSQASKELVSSKRSSGDNGDHLAGDDFLMDGCTCTISTNTTNTTNKQQQLLRGCESKCVNRQLQVECNPKTCPIELKHGPGVCQNQRLSKRLDYSKSIEIKECEGRGVGVFTTKAINKNDLIIEYIGEVITERECERRLRKNYVSEKHKYLMVMSQGLVIDATRKGNLARFLNHSCDPNCIVEEWKVRGQSCMGIFALRDIKPQEELCFDYNFQRYGDEEQKCYCGSKNCRGILGGSKDNSQDHSHNTNDQDDSDDGNNGNVNKKSRLVLGRDPVLEDDVGLIMNKTRAMKVARNLLIIKNVHDDVKRGEELFAILGEQVKSAITNKINDVTFWPPIHLGGMDPEYYKRS
jgi:hypothetical protein